MAISQINAEQQLIMLSNAQFKQLDNLVLKTKRGLLTQRLCKFLPSSLVVGAILLWSLGGGLVAIVSAVIVLITTAFFIIRSSGYQNITRATLLQHVSRQVKACEESAELVLRSDQDLPLLARLQKQRIMPVVEVLLKNDLKPHLPSYALKQPMLVLLVTVLILGCIETLRAFMPMFETQSVNQPAQTNVSESLSPNISLQSIIINSPEYTGLESVELTTWDVEALAGSSITWHVSAENIGDNPLFLQIGEQAPLELVKQIGGTYMASGIAEQSVVYFIGMQQATKKSMLGDIHTLTVIQDTRPTIKFIAPTQTITEFAKDSQPELISIVQIGDDFGLSKVEILASIASGSGEAVKFRDQKFEFDSDQWLEQQRHFTKRWNLAELGMAPGDELYFSVQAWDNRTDEPQQSRSSSKIIRWLEDEQSTVTADGILLDFIPEYFKSQRQIIIETKQLIEDKDTLSASRFEQTSRDLAIAQSDLKQKYGQFLGDEFDSGTLHTMEAGPEIEHHEEEHDDHDEDDDHGEEDEHGHQESHEHEQTASSDDKSGYSQVIEMFGHNHGEADDGNFIKKGIPSPKLLMKRAIGNMWQAELYLHLSQPSRALPFENKALELLNRARKAERVYVKRLGFEPPPVSEKRRYQGELKDILTYERQEQHQATTNIEHAFSSVLNILNTRHYIELDDSALATFEQVKAFFSEGLNEQPQDIQFVATIQKIQQVGSTNLPNCDACIRDLRNKLWQLLPSAVAVPNQKSNKYSQQNKIVRSYNEFLQQQASQVQP